MAKVNTFIFSEFDGSVIRYRTPIYLSKNISLDQYVTRRRAVNHLIYEHTATIILDLQESAMRGIV